MTRARRGGSRRCSSCSRRARWRPPGALAEGIPNAGVDLRDGWYPDQSSLTPQLVSGGTFGQLWSTMVDGQVYTQPLLANGNLATRIVRAIADETSMRVHVDVRDALTPRVGCSILRRHALLADHRHDGQA